MTGIRMTEGQLKAHVTRRRGDMPGPRPKPKRTSPYQFASKLEARYAAHLDTLKSAGEIIDWDYEALRLRLAEGARYTPDFLVVRADGMELHETKGHWREAARVRIKAAAERYPWFRFVAIQQKRGEWVFEDFS